MDLIAVVLVGRRDGSNWGGTGGGEGLKGCGGASLAFPEKLGDRKGCGGTSLAFPGELTSMESSGIWIVFYTKKTRTGTFH
jgi:hypothetical protein